MTLKPKPSAIENPIVLDVTCLNCKTSPNAYADTFTRKTNKQAKETQQKRSILRVDFHGFQLI